MIVLDVLGTPAPKGSSRAFFKAGMKRAVIVKDNDARQRGWDAAVRFEAQQIAKLNSTDYSHAPMFVDKPLAVVITFRITRPARHWAKRGGLKPSAPAVPATKPDIDKLARTTLDAMIGSIFDDDSRIVSLAINKRYAKPGDEGARITVEQWRPEIDMPVVIVERTPFAGIDRSAAVESLQHVAEPLPAAEAVKRGIETIARTEGGPR
ncbi:MAG: RusA family crossover junction endodeoxyribonuclease [Gemmatimonadota bacterium]